MKRFVIMGLIAIVAVCAAAPAFAWEFSMKGDWEWRYRYWTRTGQNDIFGEMNATQVNLGINHLSVFPTAGTTNRMGGNFGVLAGQNNYGCDMSLTDNRSTIYPKIKVNKAISVEGSVNLTSLGIWSDGDPYNFGGTLGGANAGTFRNVGFYNSMYVPIQDRPVASNVPNTFVTLQWLKASIKTPMLDFSLGYKTSAIGMGLWKHKDNRSSASFSVTAHYGPFKIGFSPYFGRDLSTWALNTNGNPSSRNTGAGSTQRQEDRRDYFKAVMGEIVYRNGPMELQLVSDSYHQPSAPAVPAGVVANRFRGAALAVAAPSDDVLRYRIALAAKYNNGRFFLNGEADWFNRWRSGRGTGNPATQLVNQNEDDQAWLYGLELGALCGPSKVTFNYVRATGDDPSTRNTSEDAAVAEQSVSAPYMKQWGYLMYYMYGTGDGWDASGNGQPTNFHHVGGRLDYALAANLNTFVVFSQAWRDQPSSYRLGGDYAIQGRIWTNDDILNWQLNGGTQQAVPGSATDIGWELDFGHDWKLLEGLTWSTTFAIWKPGNWWAYAYPNTANIYRALNSATVIGNANQAIATFNLGRDIDPLFAAETKLLISF
ncbi:MAG: hypothetical protein V1897_12735 [Pseudomonadota bacterium]